MSRMKKTSFRIVSIFVIFSFVWQDLVWAQEGSPVWARPQGTAAVAKVPSGMGGRISLPRDVAMTKDAYTGKGEKTVIAVQDAHASLGAQESIASVLDTLVTNYDVKLVALEGSSGYIDTSLLKTFPDTNVRSKTAMDLMKQGRMSAGEFFAITSDKPVTLYGIEDRPLYQENVAQFRKVYDANESIKGDLAALDAVMKALKAKAWSDEARVIEENAFLNEAGKMTLSARWDALRKIAAREGLDYTTYRNLSKLIGSLKLEGTIDFAKANKERDALIDALSKEILKQELETLIKKSLDFKMGKITQGDFYLYLGSLARQYAVDPAPYANLIRFTEYVTLYDSMDIVAVFGEMEAFEETIKERIFRNDDERKLDTFAKCVRHMQGLFELKLDGDDYAYLTEHLDTCNAAALAKFIRTMSAKYDVRIEGGYDLGRIFGEVPAAIDFYQTVEKRNYRIIANTLKRMEDERTDVAALITGGFHTKGMTELLRRKEASYVVILPKFDGSKGERPYVAILTNRQQPYRDLLKSGQYHLATAAYFDYDSAIPDQDRFEMYKGDFEKALEEAEAAARAEEKPKTQLELAALWAANYQIFYDGFMAEQARRTTAGQPRIDFTPYRPERIARILRQIATGEAVEIEGEPPAAPPTLGVRPETPGAPETPPAPMPKAPAFALLGTSALFTKVIGIYLGMTFAIAVFKKLTGRTDKSLFWEWVATTNAPIYYMGDMIQDIRASLRQQRFAKIALVAGILICGIGLYAVTGHFPTDVVAPVVLVPLTMSRREFMKRAATAVGAAKLAGALKVTVGLAGASFLLTACPPVEPAPGTASPENINIPPGQIQPLFKQSGGVDATGKPDLSWSLAEIQGFIDGVAQVTYHTNTAGWAGMAVDYGDGIDMSGYEHIVVGIRGDTKRVKFEVVTESATGAEIKTYGYLSDIPSNETWYANISVKSLRDNGARMEKVRSINFIVEEDSGTTIDKNGDLFVTILPQFTASPIAPGEVNVPGILPQYPNLYAVANRDLGASSEVIATPTGVDIHYATGSAGFAGLMLDFVDPVDYDTAFDSFIFGFKGTSDAVRIEMMDDEGFASSVIVHGIGEDIEGFRAVSKDAFSFVDLGRVKMITFLVEGYDEEGVLSIRLNETPTLPVLVGTAKPTSDYGLADVNLVPVEPGIAKPDVGATATLTYRNGIGDLAYDTGTAGWVAMVLDYYDSPLTLDGLDRLIVAVAAEGTDVVALEISDGTNTAYMDIPGVSSTLRTFELSIAPFAQVIDPRHVVSISFVVKGKNKGGHLRAAILPQIGSTPGLTAEDVTIPGTQEEYPNLNGIANTTLGSRATVTPTATGVTVDFNTGRAKTAGLDIAFASPLDLNALGQIILGLTGTTDKIRLEVSDGLAVASVILTGITVDETGYWAIPAGYFEGLINLEAVTNIKIYVESEAENVTGSFSVILNPVPVITPEIGPTTDYTVSQINIPPAIFSPVVPSGAMGSVSYTAGIADFEYRIGEGGWAALVADYETSPVDLAALGGLVIGLRNVSTELNGVVNTRKFKIKLSDGTHEKEAYLTGLTEGEQIWYLPAGIFAGNGFNLNHITSIQLIVEGKQVAGSLSAAILPQIGSTPGLTAEDVTIPGTQEEYPDVRPIENTLLGSSATVTPTATGVTVDFNTGRAKTAGLDIAFASPLDLNALGQIVLGLTGTTDKIRLEVSDGLAVASVILTGITVDETGYWAIPAGYFEGLINLEAVTNIKIYVESEAENVTGSFSVVLNPVPLIEAPIAPTTGYTDAQINVPQAYPTAIAPGGAVATLAYTNGIADLAYAIGTGGWASQFMGYGIYPANLEGVAGLVLSLKGDTDTVKLKISDGTITREIPLIGIRSGKYQTWFVPIERIGRDGFNLSNVVSVELVVEGAGKAGHLYSKVIPRMEGTDTAQEITLPGVQAEAPDIFGYGPSSKVIRNEDGVLLRYNTGTSKTSGMTVVYKAPADLTGAENFVIAFQGGPGEVRLELNDGTRVRSVMLGTVTAGTKTFLDIPRSVLEATKIDLSNILSYSIIIEGEDTEVDMQVSMNPAPAVYPIYLFPATDERPGYVRSIPYQAATPVGESATATRTDTGMRVDYTAVAGRVKAGGALAVTGLDLTGTEGFVIGVKRLSGNADQIRLTVKDAPAGTSILVHTMPFDLIGPAGEYQQWYIDRAWLEGRGITISNIAELEVTVEGALAEEAGSFEISVVTQPLPEVKVMPAFAPVTIGTAVSLLGIYLGVTGIIALVKMLMRRNEYVDLRGGAQAKRMAVIFIKEWTATTNAPFYYGIAKAKQLFGKARPAARPVPLAERPVLVGIQVGEGAGAVAEAALKKVAVEQALGAGAEVALVDNDQYFVKASSGRISVLINREVTLADIGREGFKGDIAAVKLSAVLESTFVMTGISDETREAVITLLKEVLPDIESLDLNGIARRINEELAEHPEKRKLFARLMGRIEERKRTLSAAYNIIPIDAEKDYGRKVALGMTEIAAEFNPYAFNVVNQTNDQGIINYFLYGNKLASVDEAKRFVRACGYRGNIADITFINMRGRSYEEIVADIQKAAGFADAKGIGIVATQGEIALPADTAGELPGTLLEIQPITMNGREIFVAINSYQILLKLLSDIQNGLAIDARTIPGLSDGPMKGVYRYLPRMIPIDYDKEIDTYRSAITMIRSAA